MTEYEWRVVQESATFGRFTVNMPSEEAARERQASLDGWGSGIGVPADVVEIQRREVLPWETVDTFPTTYRSRPGGLAQHNAERGWSRYG